MFWSDEILQNFTTLKQDAVNVLLVCIYYVCGRTIHIGVDVSTYFLVVGSCRNLDVKNKRDYVHALFLYVYRCTLKYAMVEDPKQREYELSA